jgi:parallel beta-helix repeat protein
VIYGPEARPTFVENEVCHNRESGIFIFAGARPYISKNICHGNHHFGIAVRDHETCPDLLRNTCRNNMLSGILLFHLAEAMMLENNCYDNQEWGLVMTPDCKTSPSLAELTVANKFDQNPRGALNVTRTPLADIGR